MVYQVLLVFQARKDPMDPKEMKDLQDHLDPLESQETKDQSAHQDPLVLLDLLVSLVLGENQVFPVYLEQMDFLETMDTQENLVRKETRDLLDTLGPLDSLGQEELRETWEKGDNQETRVKREKLG